MLCYWLVITGARPPACPALPMPLLDSPLCFQVGLPGGHLPPGELGARLCCPREAWEVGEGTGKPPSPWASGRLCQDKGWPLGGSGGYRGDIRGNRMAQLLLWPRPRQSRASYEGGPPGRQGSEVLSWAFLGGPVRVPSCSLKPLSRQRCTEPSWWSCPRALSLSCAAGSVASSAPRPRASPGCSSWAAASCWGVSLGAVRAAAPNSGVLPLLLPHPLCPQPRCSEPGGPPWPLSCSRRGRPGWLWGLCRGRDSDREPRARDWGWGAPGLSFQAQEERGSRRGPRNCPTGPARGVADQPAPVPCPSQITLVRGQCRQGVGICQTG